MIFKLLSCLLINSYYFCVCDVWVWAHAEVRPQRCGAGSPLVESKLRSWGDTVRWQAPFPAELSYRPPFLKDYCVSFRGLSITVTKTSSMSSCLQAAGKGRWTKASSVKTRTWPSTGAASRCLSEADSKSEGKDQRRPVLVSWSDWRGGAGGWPPPLPRVYSTSGWR